MKSNKVRAAFALVLAGTLAACAVPVPEFTPPPEETQVYPVLDESRLDRVLAAVNDTLAEADADADKEELTPRVSGRAAQMRGWEYSLAKATKKAELEDPYTPQPLATDPAVAIIAATDDWPRQVMVITDPPEDGNIPLLLALQQESPRDQYSLQGWARLLPGVTTPQTDAAASGSEQLAPDSEGLILTPEETVKAYADVLNKGKDSKHAKKFAEDEYRSLLNEEKKALSESLEVAGKVTQETKQAGPTYALSTFDGGAIVLSGMTTEQKYEKTVRQAKMKVGSLVAAKNDGNSEVDSTLTAVYQHMVAFYVPAEDSEDKIDVLGAERVLSSVKQPEE